MAFTWWKLFASSLRRARLRRARLLGHHSKRSDTGTGESFLRQPLDVSFAVEAKKPGVVLEKRVQHGGYAGVVSTRSRWRTTHPRKCCLSIREPSAPPIRPDGKGATFRAGKELPAGMSSADNNEDVHQGETANIPYFDEDCQEHHERDSSPAIYSAENRTPMIRMAQQFPSNHASEGQGSGGAAMPQYPRSPFVVGGPLCAEYPSYWTTTGISAVNTVDPRPLVAWTSATAAEKEQKSSASGSVPREGYKRRGLGKPPSRVANRSKHRRTYPPTGILAGKACFSSCMGVVHLQGNKLKGSDLYVVSKDFDGVRASPPPGRCRTNNGVRRSLLPPQEVIDKPQQASVCFGRYTVLIH